MSDWTRRDFMRLTASAALATMAGRARGATAGGSRPNVLFIMTDQQHWRMLSAAGNRWVKTPALDSLAATGMRFDCAYTSFPQCVPARVGLLTGRMPSWFGVEQNTAVIQSAFLPRIQPECTLGAVFRTAGYDTVYGGKVHLPKALAGEAAADAGESVSGIGFRKLSNDWGNGLARACADYLHEKRNQPFLMFASFIEPHGICGVNSRLAAAAGEPFEAWAASFRRNKRDILPAGLSHDSLFGPACPPLPGNHARPDGAPDLAGAPEYRGFEKLSAEQWRFQQWVYARLTERADAQIGTVLEALRATGQEEHTLIVFTSDHGEMGGSHLLANKRALYEEAVRVPFIVSRKGVTKPGLIDAQHLVSTGLDLLPTLCVGAGIEPPPGLPGRSVYALAEGRPAGTWRQEVGIELSRGRGLRTAQHKYMRYADGGEQLFDLASDPGEMRDLKAETRCRDVLADHRRRLDAWREAVGDKMRLDATARDHNGE